MCIYKMGFGAICGSLDTHLIHTYVLRGQQHTYTARTQQQHTYTTRTHTHIRWDRRGYLRQPRAPHLIHQINTHTSTRKQQHKHLSWSIWLQFVVSFHQPVYNQSFKNKQSKLYKSACDTCAHAYTHIYTYIHTNTHTYIHTTPTKPTTQKNSSPKNAKI
jgi:hypothetical protein